TVRAFRAEASVNAKSPARASANIASAQRHTAAYRRNGQANFARFSRATRAPHRRAQGRLYFSGRPESPIATGGLTRLHGRFQLREGASKLRTGASDQRSGYQ